MRRYLAFLVLLVALPAWADGDIFISKRKAAPAAGGGGQTCVLKDTTSTTATYNQNFGDGNDRIGLSSFYDPSGSWQVCQIDLNLKNAGTCVNNLTVKIFAVADGTGLPTGSALATSDSVACSSLTTSYAFIPFTFSTMYTLNGSTNYAVVASVDVVSGSYWPIWANTDSTGHHIYKWDDPSTWALDGGNEQGNMKVYAYE